VPLTLHLGEVRLAKKILVHFGEALLVQRFVESLSREGQLPASPLTKPAVQRYEMAVLPALVREHAAGVVTSAGKVMGRLQALMAKARRRACLPVTAREIAVRLIFAWGQGTQAGLQCFPSAFVS